MTEFNNPRLMAAAKQYNIGTHTLIDFLVSQGFSVDDLKPTTKLTHEMYATLQLKYEGLDLFTPKVPDKITPEIIDVPTQPKPAPMGTNFQHFQGPRLMAAAREFNIGIHTLIDCLVTNGFISDNLKLSSRLTKEMYEVIQLKFQNNKDAILEKEPPGLRKQQLKIVVPELTSPKILNIIDLEAIDSSTRPSKAAKNKKVQEAEDANAKLATPLHDIKTDKQSGNADQKPIEERLDIRPDLDQNTKGEPPKRENLLATRLTGPKIIGKIQFYVDSDTRPKKDNDEKHKRKRVPILKKPGAPAGTLVATKVVVSASADCGSTIDSWKAFIKAQEIFVNQYAEPFSIKYSKTDREALAHFTIEQKDPLLNIIPSLKKSFPGILEEDINVKEGYLLYDSTKIPAHLDELKETLETNYFDFNYKPCFSGYVKLEEDPYKWLEKLNGQKPNKEGQILATLTDIKTIDETLGSLVSFSRLAALGGIFKVQPSKFYLNKQYEFITSNLIEEVGIKSIMSFDNCLKIIIENIFLKERILNFIKENSAFHRSYHNLIFTINPELFQNFLQTRKSKRIYFKNEDSSSRMGVILPDPKGNEFHLNYDSKISLQDLRFEIFHFKRVFERYFGPDSFTFKQQHVFQIDKAVLQSQFLVALSNVIPDDRFFLSTDKETISFDFNNEDQLQASLQVLSELQIADIDFKGAEHGFKIKLEYNSPLIAIQKELQQIPAVKNKLSSNGLKLSFFCFFDNHDLLPLLVAKIKDAIDPMLTDNMQHAFEELGEGKLKYFLNFKQDEYESEVISKFNYLRGEEICLWDAKKPIAFGSIIKISYPSISIKMESITEEICLPTLSNSVCCTLKGERDKIMRLSNTIDIIFSITKQKILNEKLRAILMDSSKAKSLPGDILRTPEYEKSITEIDSSLLSKNINERQKEAIAKCLLAEDFFLIQGPPGTGKSTAIAELIWQHIRSNITGKEEPYRILVTSETNLAVDNALDKLRSKTHLLIKPIRFGSEDKLDKEGRRFSLEALKQWVVLGNKELTEDSSATNILQDWISLISSRAKNNHTTVNSDLSDKWLMYLSNSNENLRTLFFNNYIRNANVIGATCSSIGKENSEQKFTRFFSDYCNVVHTKEYNAFRLSINKKSIAALKSRNIEFDLVVQDEASKASPPELAMPCLFGKKAVVIGDHRQLPPMVDTNEFIDNLKMMSKKTKDAKNRDEINDLISYIKRNKEEFSISHFEKLFNAVDANLKSSFNMQYRMHPAINETIKQFYIADGGLECGIPDEIANSEDMSHPLNRHHGITANKKTHVIWLDVNTPEIKNGTSRVNYGEIDAIDWLLSQFEKSPGYKKFVDHWPLGDVDQKQIGIITFYGAQAGLLNKLKDKYPIIPLRISPVDRFQGMERNVVIVSLVRSNSIAEFPNQAPDMEAFPGKGYPSQESLGFAEFPNRLNVALSRAKRLLIIVGNSQHFRKHAIYNKVYETILHHPNGAVKPFDTKSFEK